MALLNKLTTEGSLLTSLDGKKPLEYDRQTVQIAGLTKSQLDLDGKIQKKYLDNLPK